MKILASIALAVAVCAPALAGPSGTSTVSRLTIYDAGVAEVLEERTVDLQTGLNVVEFRSLLPGAYLGTVRVTAEGADLVRQDVTRDGARIGDSNSPVLHVQVRNKGAAGPRRITVDYLIPKVGWSDDYSLVFDQPANGAPPTSAELDSWVSVTNNVGADLVAGTVDLVAGELALRVGDRMRSGYPSISQNVAVNNIGMSDGDSSDEPTESATPSSVSAFSRFTLGNDVTLQSNADVSRFPLLQHARVGIVQRNVFENSAEAETLARGGFILQPRGLEVRLVSQNTTGAAMPAGTVTVYARNGGVAQVVGQDTIVHTAPGQQFAVSLGRSSTLLGTRKIVERREDPYEDQRGRREMRVMTVEVEITNRGAAQADAYVRDAVERYGDNRWKVRTSSSPYEQLGAGTIQFAVKVPAGGSTKVTYTIEIR